MPLCGPKLSLCGVVISAWGILQLSLMGVFFYIHSVALIEDIPLEVSPIVSLFKRVYLVWILNIYGLDQGYLYIKIYNCLTKCSVV